MALINSHMIMYMGVTMEKMHLPCILSQLSPWWKDCLVDIMRLFLHTVKLDQGKRLQWEALSFRMEMITEE